jgi:hypothetical protein
MRRPLSGLLLAFTLLAATVIPARTAHADPPPPLAPRAAPVVAPAWASPLAGTRRRSSGVMVLGVVLASFGALGMASGTAVYAQAVGGCTTTIVGGNLIRTNCDNGAAKGVGMTMLLVGSVAAAAGVPLWVYGAEKVASTEPSEPPPPPVAALLVSPGGATFKVSF